MEKYAEFCCGRCWYKTCSSTSSHSTALETHFHASFAVRTELQPFHQATTLNLPPTRFYAKESLCPAFFSHLPSDGLWAPGARARVSCSQRPGEAVGTARVAASPEEGAELAHPQFSLGLGMTSALWGRGDVRLSSCPPRPQPARATSIPASS